MTTLRLLFSNHLSENISTLEECDKNHDIVLMCETKEEATYVKHHKKKIAFLWSAMRHFALELEDKGYQVRYVKLKDKNNTSTFTGEIERAITEHNINSLVVTCPGDYKLLQKVKSWSDRFDVELNLLPDNRFLCSKDEFRQWAKGRKTLRMEYFYREMRLKHDILVDLGHPVGGQWNYDSDNRKPPEKDLVIPAPYHQEIDSISQEVIDLVEKEFNDHFGDLEPFYFAVTRDQALKALDLFIEERLPFFGDYQDAMIQGEPWMYHSHLSFYLNSGLLMAEECLHLAEKAYQNNKAPLNAVEGFIRQILGWREYVRGIYWLKMPEYKEHNFFEATRKLPDFYWTAKTPMNCLSQCIKETRENAYAHHIQRLMVLGNFALVAGIHPSEVNEWFLIVYADAFEWVELPNVSGMILFADGGYLASKPYAAGGSYINKMSNYCKGCSYNVSRKNGPKACPFNYLYWDFLSRNREKLSKNHRLGMMYKVYDRMSNEKKDLIKNDSHSFLQELD